MGLRGGPQGSNLFPQAGRISSSRNVAQDIWQKVGKNDFSRFLKEAEAPLPHARGSAPLSRLGGLANFIC